MKYGIEFEFFVNNKKTDKVVPAYEATHNLDGNPIVGELNTKIHNNITDAVFELKKLIHLEQKMLESKGYEMLIIPMIKLDKQVLLGLRKDSNYVNRKELEILDAKSVYGKGIGKVLPRGVYKASCQLNISKNSEVMYPKYKKIEVEDKYKWESTIESRSYSEVFDFVSVIKDLDSAFIDDIKNTNRVKGVYAIKNGELGKRVEYRSLPNTIDLDTLCNFKFK